LAMGDSKDTNIRTSWSTPVDLEIGEYEVILTEPQLLLSTGTYNFTIGISSYEKAIQYLDQVASLNISELSVDSLDPSIIRTSQTGVLLNPMKITFKKLDKDGTEKI
jgi:lipopolysaccharide transport system ATP-binding protein